MTDIKSDLGIPNKTIDIIWKIILSIIHTGMTLLTEHPEDDQQSDGERAQNYLLTIEGVAEDKIKYWSWDDKYIQKILAGLCR